jgi:hypothetical protein
MPRWWIYYGGLVSREGEYVVPKRFVRPTKSARAMNTMVGDDFGSSWGWGGWPLLHSRGCNGVASDATYHIAVSVQWGIFL